ncbi:MFS transporter (plasmid) [Streptomyces sp. BI20]|uniref:MFS transporter n=1 Tax=Streptomyces sp. BI20 TaxID=3403460 RepID=UPI003C72099A
MARAGVLGTNRDFRRYWISSSLSTLGSQMSLIAFPLLVLSLGYGAANAGLVATCSLVTRMLLRLPAGQVADRVDRRRLMLGTDLVRMAALAGIPLAAVLDVLTFPQLLVVAVVEGTATALFTPAGTIAVRDVVAEEDLPDALAKGQASMGAASLVGPFLGGWLYAVDPILPFTVDAVSYGVSAFLVWRMRVRPMPAAASGGPPDRRLTAGFRLLFSQPPLRRALVFAALLNLVGASAEVAMVVGLKTGGTSSTVIGLVMACAGVGAVLGSLAAPRLMRALSAGRLFLLIGAVWAGGLAVFASTSRPVVLGPLLVLMVLLTPVAGVVLGEAMLKGTPRELLGRVSTAVGLLASGPAAFGPGAAGVSIAFWGVAPTWATMAALVAVSTLLCGLPMLRDRDLTTRAEKPAEQREPEEKREREQEPEVIATQESIPPNTPEPDPHAPDPREPGPHEPAPHAPEPRTPGPHGPESRDRRRPDPA